MSPRRRVTPDSSSDDYVLGPTLAQKQASRRRASAKYYARNPHLRHENRLLMRERRWLVSRAAAKAKRRQWDPPKGGPGRVSLTPAHIDTHEGSDASYHYRDWRGATESLQTPSRYHGCRLATESSLVHSGCHRSNVSEEQRVALDVLATSVVIDSTWSAVSQINAQPFTPPTALEERGWIRRDFDFRGQFLAYQTWQFIQGWKWEVYQKTQLDPDTDLAYITCNEIHFKGEATVLFGRQSEIHRMQGTFKTTAGLAPLALVAELEPAEETVRGVKPAKKTGLAEAAAHQTTRRVHGGHATAAPLQLWGFGWPLYHQMPSIPTPRIAQRHVPEVGDTWVGIAACLTPAAVPIFVAPFTPATPNVSAAALGTGSTAATGKARPPRIDEVVTHQLEGGVDGSTCGPEGDVLNVFANERDSINSGWGMTGESRAEGVVPRAVVPEDLAHLRCLILGFHPWKKSADKKTPRKRDPFWGESRLSVAHTSTMPSTPLRKTNMTAAEMVPDRQTAGHDPRYWCLPPMREDPDAVVPISGGHEFHLVCQGREMGDCREGNGHRLSRRGAQRSFHVCSLYAGMAGALPIGGSSAPRGSGPHERDVERGERAGRDGEHRLASGAQALLFHAKLTAHLRNVDGAPWFSPWPQALLRHMGAGIVYSTKYAARLAFEDAVEEGRDPELLSSDEFEVALAYAEGDFF
ncbi:hypothetical protein B0H12DRAFT_1068720 [Mycena haematopus]|nr:hypothetical protein B0H12DRAFT_1068720 [Mycena haematopus]